ncbi:hypothetical protein [Lacipirellula limnantheis]|uniref:Uncharacterized protein n=1 Tax=Lacipirellula limnantheis TaxID=2528024 RepID=A0A517TTM4_9BACT|nr:hypothetical protein [Lacipirellula limnantheis]QDT71725.1 hypothetical protein I41_08850 [Lacipirellula limnantheis]
MRFPLVAASLIVGVGSFFPALGSTAEAADYGAYVVCNPTSTALHYQVKWGDGEWKSYCVYPGYVKSHYHELDCEGAAPKPRVRFDYVGGDEQVTYQTYAVDMTATDCPSNGKRYTFKFSRCGTYLELYR